MPVPNPADPYDDRPSRFAMQLVIFGLYLIVAIGLLFSSWRTSVTSELSAHIIQQQTAILNQQAAGLEQQSAILREIKEARASIPAEVKSAIPDVVKGVLK